LEIRGKLNMRKKIKREIEKVVCWRIRKRKLGETEEERKEISGESDQLGGHSVNYLQFGFGRISALYLCLQLLE
jgi:hypothetical protein